MMLSVALVVQIVPLCGSVVLVVQIVPLCGSVLPSLCYSANAAA